MKVQSSIEITAPPEKIWPFLIQPTDILKWCITFQKCEFVGQQRSGVGASFYVEEKAGGPLMKLNFKVTEWVENQKLAFKMTSGTFVKAYEQHWTIESLDSGSRFNFSEDVTMPWGILGKLIGFFGRSSSEKHVKEMLIKLKSLAES
jgi:predicted transposase YbfD/YdcC